MSSTQHSQACAAKRRTARGVTLIEALVAMLIMTFGMVALVGIQSSMRRGADLAKQRGEALRIAQQDLETARGYWTLPAPASAPVGTVSYQSLTSQAANNLVGDPQSNAAFTLTRTVTDWVDGSASQPQTLAGLKALKVEVSWVDRANETQRVELNTFIAKADPALSGSLSVPTVSSPIRRPGEREASIPAEARDLGDRTSVFKPLSGGTVAWIFNNLTGVISSKCTVPASSQSATLTAADLQNCTTINGLLLSGRIWFSNQATDTPDARHPEGTALPLTLELSNILPAPTQMPGYDCFHDAPRATDLPSPLRFVTYYCVVYPALGTPTVWSSGVASTPRSNQSPNVTYDSRNERSCPTGRSAGFRVNIADPVQTNRWTVCRYSADFDGNGKLSNGEHPRSYINVSKSLTGQNFLIIKGRFDADGTPINTCPIADTPNPSAGVFVNYSTVWHQPAKFNLQQQQNPGLETNIDNLEGCSLAQ